MIPIWRYVSENTLVSHLMLPTDSGKEVKTMCGVIAPSSTLAPVSARKCARCILFNKIFYELQNEIDAKSRRRRNRAIEITDRFAEFD